jgi:hypothetical protein
MILGTSLSLSAVAHWGRWQYGAYVGIAGTFTFLLPFFIGFNVYYRQWWVYQIMVWFACWSWPVRIEQECWLFSF